MDVCMGMAVAGISPCIVTTVCGGICCGRICHGMIVHCGLTFRDGVLIISEEDFVI
jgi:hypothetical protein